MTYERVTYRPEGRSARSVLLGNVKVHTSEADPTAKILSGDEVDREGETRWFERRTTCRHHVIALDLVVRRVPLRLNLDLGVLEAAPVDTPA